MVDRATLLTDLKKLLKLLQDDLRTRCDEHAELDAPARAEWQATRDVGRTAEDYTVWREEWLMQVAAAWLLAAVFVRFMEDNDLITPPRLSGPENRRRLAQDNRTQYFNEFPAHSDREYMLHVFEKVSALPAADRLFDRRHNPLWRLGPSGDFAARIVEFWHRINPATGELVHDFTDSEFDTRFLGDLYQDLSEAARKKYALLQTPDFVEEFILDRTLTPAIETFGYRDVRLIDPACGSGHFLLGSFKRLLEMAQRHEPGTNPRELVRRTLSAVYGVDINPFAVAIARFRLLVVALRACGVTRLAEAPALPLEVYTGDSLLLGRRFSDTRGLNVPLDPDATVRRALVTEDAQALDRVLGQQYHVVVGNPPYITPKDDALNRAYRERYGSCYRTYSLAVPFMERLFELAFPQETDSRPAGYVGMITANSFMKREFGKRVIEAYIPRWDLTHVVDTDKAHLLGHATGTVILFGRNRAPVEPTIRAVLGIRKEEPAPLDPKLGRVWAAIVDQIDKSGSVSTFINVVDLPRASFQKHPWSIGGGGAAELKELLETNRDRLKKRVDAIGFFLDTHADEAFVQPRSFVSRFGLTSAFRDQVRGDGIREWVATSDEMIFFPFDDALHQWKKVPHEPQWSWLHALRTELWSRSVFGGSNYRQVGRPWFDYHQFPKDRARVPFLIAFAEVATHNHFVVAKRGTVFNRTAPVIKLKSGTSEQEHLALLGLLNSSSACFWLRQVCHDKGAGGIGGGIASEAWEHRFAFNATNVQRFPLPEQLPLDLATKLQRLSNDLTSSAPASVLSAWSENTNLADALSANRARFEVCLEKMIALQEELDWKVYALYGLGDDLALNTENALPPVKLGERAFEIVLARKVQSGIVDTAWFHRHRSTLTFDVPTRWPRAYRDCVERRIEAIESNANVNLIEQPDYKRRWNVESWGEQNEQALKGWLLDRLEACFRNDSDAIELTSCVRLAERAKRDRAFVEVSETYRGHADCDVVKLVTELVMSEAVPFLSVLRYRDAGLRKREAWERSWELQRQEDEAAERGGLPAGHDGRPSEARGEDATRDVEVSLLPKYESEDFRSDTFWRLRGKLDIPKERFISYPHVSRDTDPSPVIAWAGWSRLQQARALSTYYLLVKEQDGWTPTRLSPLLAGLLELIPGLKECHNEIDPETGERLGDYFGSFLDTQMRSLRLTEATIRAWKP